MNREEAKRILQENEYGDLPEKPVKIESKVTAVVTEHYASKAVIEKIELTLHFKNGKEFTFPIEYCYPVGAQSIRTVISLSFDRVYPNRYYPAEEILDRGWAVASVCYEDVTNDKPDFTDGIAPIFEGMNTGKIMMWAYAAMRIMDYLETRPETDCSKVGVIGHSRLGKTALVTAAFDERFAFAHSNDSGCCGARLFSETVEDSETISHISRVFKYWFVPDFNKYVGKECEMPFDQDLLVGLIAPRYVSIGSAELDYWANPKGELACAVKSSHVWEEQGLKGLYVPDEIELCTNYHDGCVGYYCRKGTHSFSREDWNRALDFFDKKIAEM